MVKSFERLSDEQKVEVNKACKDLADFFEALGVNYSDFESRADVALQDALQYLEDTRGPVEKKVLWELLVDGMKKDITPLLEEMERDFPRNYSEIKNDVLRLLKNPDDPDRKNKLKEYIKRSGLKEKAAEDFGRAWNLASDLRMRAQGGTITPEEAGKARQSLEKAKSGVLEWAKVMPLIVFYMVIIGLIYAIVVAIQEIEKNTKSGKR